MAASDELIPYLYQAMASKYGIVMRTTNFGVTRARLYKARADVGDPDLARLQFRPDYIEPESLLWIIKGEVPNAA